MRLFLLATEKGEKRGLGDADNLRNGDRELKSGYLETNSGNITDSVTRTTETGNEDFILREKWMRSESEATYVLINEVKTTITRNEGSDLLAVLDQLATNGLTNSGVGLLGLNTTMNIGRLSSGAYIFSVTIPLAMVAPPRTLALMEAAEWVLL